jgi:GDSL-like lipase/acylhydrolase family protein
MLQRHLGTRLDGLYRAALLAGLSLFSCLIPAVELRGADTAFPLQTGDRLAFIGSSSTNIGVWPRTMEFLLHTRHPELKVTCKKFSAGGGTFATGVQNFDKWTAEFKPTIIFFNYGSNDAGGGEKGLPALRDNMEKCFAKAKSIDARVIFMTPQAADVRKAGEAAAGRRKMYAEKMIALGKEKAWTVIDVHTPLEALQQGARRTTRHTRSCAIPSI